MASYCVVDEHSINVSPRQVVGCAVGRQPSINVSPCQVVVVLWVSLARALQERVVADKHRRAPRPRCTHPSTHKSPLSPPPKKTARRRAALHPLGAPALLCHRLLHPRPPAPGREIPRLRRGLHAGGDTIDCVFIGR